MRTRRAGHDVVVVVSAMGDTTDELLALAKQVSPNPDRRELDMLLTAGERISMALLSMAIRELGGDAISFTGSQSGIITNDRHVDARIIEVRPFRVQDELARGKIVVIAGYQGVSYRREVTTLGRGGSDTTAVAMAAALGAEYCEICSDVDGVYTADPRVVPAARRIGTLSYEETQELAESGAKVLNAQAVEFAKEQGIAIYARATSVAAAGRRSVGRRHRRAAPSAAHAGHGRRRRQRARRARLHVDGDSPRPRHIGSAAVAVLAARSTSTTSPASSCTSTGDRLTLVVSRENLHEEARVRDALAARFGDERAHQSTRSAPSASSAPASTRRSRTCGAARRRCAAPASRSSGDRDLVVPHHLDDRPRAARRRGAAAARDVHRARQPSRDATDAVQHEGQTRQHLFGLNRPRPSQFACYDDRPRPLPPLRPLRHAVRRTVDDLSEHARSSSCCCAIWPTSCARSASPTRPSTSTAT